MLFLLLCHFSIWIGIVILLLAVLNCQTYRIANRQLKTIATTIISYDKVEESKLVTSTLDSWTALLNAGKKEKLRSST